MQYNHDKFTRTIQDEAEYDREDVWMKGVHNDFLKLQFMVIDCVKLVRSYMRICIYLFVLKYIPSDGCDGY